MTPTFVPERFVRVMGCTAPELLSWLPRALPTAARTVAADGASCTAQFPTGTLTLRWHDLPKHRIALLVMPQLSVEFSYSGFDADARYAVQKKFDLETHRGGG